jgi:hypothetical protein
VSDSLLLTITRETSCKSTVNVLEIMTVLYVNLSDTPRSSDKIVTIERGTDTNTHTLWSSDKIFISEYEHSVHVC